MLEYSAHLVPKSGYKMMPVLSGDGIMVAGDAAACCIVTGINLEGINLAVQSGVLAGQAAIQAAASGQPCCPAVCNTSLPPAGR